MIISQMFILFIVASFGGWVYECIYCTINTKHWQNRGFLHGPICPIYGAGVAAAYGLFRLLPLYVPKADIGTDTAWWKIFIICAVGSAVLEYVTSYVLEKRFHALWWDYSKMPLNINGRICLPATTAFGVAGVMIVKFLIPYISAIPANDHPLINEISALCLMMVLGMDIAITNADLSDLIQRIDAVEKEFNERMESGVVLVQEGPAAVAAAAGNAARNAAETVRDKGREATLRRQMELEDRKNALLAELSERQKYNLRSIRELRLRSSGETERKIKLTARSLQEAMMKRITADAEATEDEARKAVDDPLLTDTYRDKNEENDEKQ